MGRVASQPASQVEVQRIVAVDWSGDRSVAGQRRKIWAGVWTENSAGSASVNLETGRTREQLIGWLIELALETPRMVVGVDFCFSYPAWFVREHGATSAPEFWKTVAAHGEHWLSRECDDVRFWGRPRKKPPEFCGADGAARMLRLADLECKVPSYIQDEAQAAKIKGIAPKSPFQIGGAGAVGTGSIRGMRILHELAEAGFTIWPFEPAGDATIIEIYPRLFTGKVVKSSAQACLQHLNAHYPKDELPDLFRGMAAATEDGFDAAVSALEMARAPDALRRLPDGDDIDRIEGRIWTHLP